MGLRATIYARQKTKSFPVQTEYQAVLDKATALGYTLPSTENKRLQNNMVYYLKQEGIWGELDLLYIFKCDVSDFTKINWKDPNSYLLTTTTTPTFETNLGWAAATNSFFNTNYIPSTNAVKTLVNNSSVFWNHYGSSNIGSVYGTRNSSSNNFWGTQSNTYMHAPTASSGYSSTVLGANLHIKDGTSHRHYRNGLSIGSVVYTSSTLSSNSLHLFALNTNGALSGFATAGTFKLSYFGIGSKLVESKALELYKILNNTF